jgi:hypothetical protein
MLPFKQVPTILIIQALLKKHADNLVMVLRVDKISEHMIVQGEAGKTHCRGQASFDMYSGRSVIEL